MRKVCNDHVEVWAPAILYTPDERLALLEVVGARSAVKSIWATLTKKSGITLEEGNTLTGMPPYRRLAAPVTETRQIHALLWADLSPDADWSVGVRSEIDEGDLLLDVLRADIRLPLPLVDQWAQPLWETAGGDLFHPLKGYGPYAGIVYRADLTAWVQHLDRLLKSGQIVVPDRVEWS